MLKLAVVLVLLGVVLGVPTDAAAPPRLEGRIVGGDETDIEHYPWQLALLYYLRHFCGAVLVQPKFALTSAQCLEGALVSNLAVRAGSTIKSSGGQLVDVRQYHIHPNYNLRTVDYDFALLDLVETVSVQTAALVALPEPNYPVFSGDVAIMSGWGVLSQEGITPEILRVVESPVISNARCQSAYPGNTITSRMFCTGRMGIGGVNPCQGDVGGPVIVAGHLAGIISWGTGCALADYPAVHANVGSVVDWIYETTG